MNAIELTHVCKAFPGFAIQDLSLAVPSGTICGLVGENGAGKTTAIRLMLGALRPDSGRCTLLGVDTDSPQILAAKEDVGVVLDEAYFPEALNAVQVGKILAKTYRRWDKDRYDGYLDRFSLPRDKQFKDFSRGMKMKLAIAAALSHGAKLLLLDEATSGLDPMVRDEVLDVFNEFTRDETHTVVLSSHIVSDLEKICDYIAFLHKGKLILFEEKDQLLEEYAIVKLSPAQLAELDRSAVAGVKQGPYGAEALVKRNQIPAAFVTEHTTLEDIILFLAKTQTEMQ